MKVLISCGLAAAIALATFSMPASAHGVVGVSVRVAPPPPRVERVVVARPGQVWIRGHWRWHGGRYVWTGGYWTAARPGYRYVPARWVASGPDWRFHAGYWVRVR